MEVEVEKNSPAAAVVEIAEKPKTFLHELRAAFDGAQQALLQAQERIVDNGKFKKGERAVAEAVLYLRKRAAACAIHAHPSVTVSFDNVPGVTDFLNTAENLDSSIRRHAMEFMATNVRDLYIQNHPEFNEDPFAVFEVDYTTESFSIYWYYTKRSRTDEGDKK